VRFNFPTHLPYLYVFRLSLFLSDGRQRWIGQHIPRSDAKWIGTLVAIIPAADPRRLPGSGLLSRAGGGLCHDRAGQDCRTAAIVDLAELFRIAQRLGPLFAVTASRSYWGERSLRDLAGTSHNLHRSYFCLFFAF
jgi:hypothetical protein